MNKTQQTISRLEFSKRWNDHLNDFKRLLLAWNTEESSYSEYQKFKGELDQAIYKMQEVIYKMQEVISKASKFKPKSDEE